MKFLILLLCASCTCHHAACERGDAYKDSRDAAMQEIYRSRKLESDQRKALPQSYVASCRVKKKCNRDDCNHWENDTDRTWGSGNRDTPWGEERDCRKDREGSSQDDRGGGSPSSSGSRILT